MNSKMIITRRPLSKLLDPKSVAVIGASDDPKRIGGRPLQYLLTGTFAGQVYAVNAKRNTVQGIQAYKTILDVPGSVDAVIVAVPAPVVIQTIRDCAKKGVGAAVIFTSGFAEQDTQGEEWQKELTQISIETGHKITWSQLLRNI